MATTKQKIESEQAPQAIGPYSQAIRVGKTLYCSGQIGLDPDTKQLVDGGTAAQTKRVMQNLEAVLNSAGAGFAQVVKSTILVQDLNDFQIINEIYASFLKEPYPARATYEVARLPLDAKVEIEMLAVLDD